jgi:transcriptional regulator with PAS, ATPase and Fis domain
VILDGAPAGAIVVAGALVGAGDAADAGRVIDLVELAAREVEAAHAALPARRHAAPDPGEPLLGHSPAMQAVLRLVEKVAASDATVLIQGESGTGKELIARAIHFRGARARKPFVVQNCSALNDNLLETALFGHVKGAFTGAVRDHRGLFEVAHGGTFFLDEVGDMSPALQVKLLRVLQEGVVTPVGGTSPTVVDVRVVAATHKELERMVARGEFRDDLYYRINVVKVTVPPLRERIEDVPLLAEHFLRRHARAPRGAPRLAEEALAALMRWAWPGNIRELENEIERMLVLARDLEVLPVELLSPRLRDGRGGGGDGERPEGERTLREAVVAAERDAIQRGLARTRGNRSLLARELGVSRASLIAKIKRYGLGPGAARS